MAHHVSTLAKHRWSEGSIKLETGCYEGLDMNDRVCPICSLEIESEEHVLTSCPAYHTYRDVLYSTVFHLNEMNDI